jgi:ketosteroid isomerase-like protein
MPDVHVVPKQDRWGVEVDGVQQVAFDTQKQAIQKGRDLARTNRAELVIHGRDGKIREKNSYGNDPEDSKG